MQLLLSFFASFKYSFSFSFVNSSSIYSLLHLWISLRPTKTIPAFFSITLINLPYIAINFFPSFSLTCLVNNKDEVSKNLSIRKRKSSGSSMQYCITCSSTMPQRLLQADAPGKRQCSCVVQQEGHSSWQPLPPPASISPSLTAKEKHNNLSSNLKKMLEVSVVAWRRASQHVLRLS